MPKCTHNRATLIAEYNGFRVIRCTWDCRQHVIQLDSGLMLTAAEIAGMRSAVEAGKAVITEGHECFGGKETYGSDLWAQLCDHDKTLDDLVAALAALGEQ